MESKMEIEKSYNSTYTSVIDNSDHSVAVFAHQKLPSETSLLQDKYVRKHERSVAILADDVKDLCLTEKPKLKMKKATSIKNTKQVPYAVNHGLFYNDFSDPMYIVYTPLKTALENWFDKFEDKDKDKIRRLILNLWDCNVSMGRPDIFDFDRCKNLESFPDLTQCPIRLIGLAGFKRSHHFFSCFPLELVELDLSNTGLKSTREISDLLYKLVHLEVLDLEKNALKNIPVVAGGHSSLKKLSLSDNAISFLIRNNSILLSYPCLSGLSLNNNPLGYIPLCPNMLTTLCLANMNLKDDDLMILKELNELRTLNISNNFFTILPEIASTKLSFLDCQGNKLNDKNGALSLKKFHCIFHVNLSDNQLTKIPYINDNITVLNLNGNKIAFNSSILHLMELSNLMTLRLKNNCLKHFSINFSNVLDELDLSGNQLTEIPHINDKVRFLYLNDNQIASNASILNLMDLNELKILELKNNCLKEFSVNFSSILLSQLNLSGNQLTEFPCINDKVQLLYLNDNQIASNFSILRLERLNKLRFLDLRNNSLTSFPFNFSEELYYMDLSGNNINQYDDSKKIVSKKRLIIDITHNPLCQHVSQLQLFPSHGAVLWLDGGDVINIQKEMDMECEIELDQQMIGIQKEVDEECTMELNQ